MSTKNLLLGVILLISSQAIAQSNLSYQPEKPQAGDNIQITYSPPQNLTNSSSPLTAIVYTMGNGGENAHDINFKKNGNSYTGIVKTDTADNFVFFSFSKDGNFDNNSGKGYWLRLYDGDQLKTGANWSAGMFFMGYNRNAGMNPDNEKAVEYMNKEFKVNPAYKTNNIAIYSRLYGLVHKDEASAFFQKQIESIIQSGLKNENDYMALEQLYSLAKLPQQSKFIRDVAIEKFPNGKLAKGEYIGKFNREKDIAKKEQMLQEITEKIKTDSSWKYLEPSLTFYQNSIINAYYQKKDWQGMEAAIKKYDVKGTQLAFLLNNAAWQIQQTDKNLDKAEKMAATAVAVAKKEWKNPSDKKPDYLSESQWEKSRARDYGMYADTYGMVNYKLGNYKKGFPFSEEAALKIEKGKNADENNTYALLAEKVLPARKYVPQLEQFVKEGKATSSVKDILKRAYIKKHKSEKGYDEYITALQKDAYLEMVAELKKEILSEKSPQFSLVDLKGNKVNIEDLKNKVVVVDFWATWCGPCKASFPGMQKMVTKYKNDPDVKFVFVDTWETSKEKEKNAQDFITNNKYDFHVLMDNDSKVVEQFKVNGIPTKFVIDKNGIIRFKAVGFDGSDDKLVNELTAMIDMARTM
ncbi:MAG: TlpA family protein disulfide reductase [Ginsengibacter sp.]